MKMDPEDVKAYAQLVAACANVAWPVVIVVLACVFRRDLSSVAARLRKGKFFGQEIELKELDALEAARKAAESKPLPTPTSLPDPTPQMRTGSSIPGLVDSERSRLQAAAESRMLILEQNIFSAAIEKPVVGLIELAAALERESRRALAVRGLINEWRPGLKQLASILKERGLISEESRVAMAKFADVRNAIIHGARADDGDVIRALDSGLAILKIITASPPERFIVHRIGIPIFADEECLHMHTGVGVMLEVVGPNSATNFRMFPTTRNHFVVGKEVSWEWNLEQIWGPAWFKDPTTQKPERAWQQSAEFVGRILDEI